MRDRRDGPFEVGPLSACCLDLRLLVARVGAHWRIQRAGNQNFPQSRRQGSVRTRSPIAVARASTAPPARGLRQQVPSSRSVADRGGEIEPLAQSRVGSITRRIDSDSRLRESARTATARSFSRGVDEGVWRDLPVRCRVCPSTGASATRARAQRSIPSRRRPRSRPVQQRPHGSGENRCEDARMHRTLIRWSSAASTAPPGRIAPRGGVGCVIESRSIDEYGATFAGNTPIAVRPTARRCADRCTGSRRRNSPAMRAVAPVFPGPRIPAVRAPGRHAACRPPRSTSRGPHGT